MNIKVILPAGEMPLGSVVTKRTGEKEYILADRITLYGGEKPYPEIKAATGTLILIDPNSGNGTAISTGLELAWTMYEEELLRWLESREYERDSK